MATRKKTKGKQRADEDDSDTEERSIKFKEYDIDSFNAENEEWEYWFARFKYAISASKVRNEVKRRDYLLAKCSAKPFRVLRDHFYPDNLEDVPYKELVEVLEKNYGRKDMSLCERLRFTQVVRAESETVTDFMSRLRAQAHKCQFGHTLQERLRDQFVFGINHSNWQQEILRKYPSVKSKFEDIETLTEILENAQIQQKNMEQVTNQNRYKSLNINPVSNKQTSRDKAGKITLIQGKHCFKCGGNLHKDAQSCPAIGSQCSFCKRPNHYTRVCIKTGNIEIIKKKWSTNQIRDHGTSDSASSVAEEETINFIRKIKNGNEAYVKVKLNDVPIEMLFDSGASKSVISEQLWKSIGSPRLKKTPNLTAYTGHKIETLGETKIDVQGFNKRRKLTVIVTKANDTPLFGMNWILSFKIPLPPGATVRWTQPDTQASQEYDERDVQSLIREFSEVFRDGTGTIRNHKAVIHLKDNVVPKIYRPRRVPFAMRDAVEAELKRLVDADILEEVNPTVTPIEWASPLVVSVKSNGKLRLCGDFKVTINPCIHTDYHPIPTFEELATKLNGGEQYTIIDLRDAYLQLEVEETSRKYLVIATHKGFFRYRKLPFGVSFAPGLFQRTIETILVGIPGVANYIDDIIVTGTSREEHMARVRQVLKRLKDAGLRTQKEKCKWFQNRLIYLGHLVDKNGIMPTNEHLEAIKHMPDPTNTKELRSILGTINYYSKFVPNLQSICAPLHQLLCKGVKWKWTPKDSRIIAQVKDTLLKGECLAHYDASLPLILSTDASDVGVGAVLFHRYHDSSEKPIYYASRTLSSAERKYSALDKETLAIIFGLHKFKQYLIGRHFIIRTDHKPLVHLLGEQNEIPKLAANRLTRWALTLAAFDYEIQHHAGHNNVPADTLSRLPLPNVESSKFEKEGVEHGSRLLHIILDDIALSKRHLRQQLLHDPLLSKVIRFIQNGWPQSKTDIPDKEIHTFFEKRLELSYEEKLLIWQGRLVIPSTLRQPVLGVLHEGHPGITGMRSVARCHVWWPNMDTVIEIHVQTCATCQENRPREQEVPLYSWSVPSEPWSRIHIDFCGPFQSKYWLIVIDATTKWLEVFPMERITSTKTIQNLRELFARCGLPRTIVSDNGPQLTSYEFKSFCEDNNITHITSTPYHPKTNGLAEREVRTFKSRMKALSAVKDTNLRLQKFLFSYRITPQKTTGRSPSELFYGRNIRSRLDLLKPSVEVKIDNSIVTQKVNHDRKTRVREFAEGDTVWVEDVLKHTFEEGVIKKKTGRYHILWKSGIHIRENMQINCEQEGPGRYEEALIKGGEDVASRESPRTPCEYTTYDTEEPDKYKLFFSNPPLCRPTTTIHPLDLLPTTDMCGHSCDCHTEFMATDNDKEIFVGSTKFRCPNENTGCPFTAKTGCPFTNKKD